MLLSDNVTPFTLSGFGVHCIDFHDKIVLGREERHTLLMGHKRTCVACDLTSSTTHILVHLTQIHKTLSPPSPMQKAQMHLLCSCNVASRAEIQ